MSFAKVKLIYLRELRDQLRDRRTLFTIFVVPAVYMALAADHHTAPAPEADAAKVIGG